MQIKQKHNSKQVCFSSSLIARAVVWGRCQTNSKIQQQIRFSRKDMIFKKVSKNDFNNVANNYQKMFLCLIMGKTFLYIYVAALGLSCKTQDLQMHHAGNLVAVSEIQFQAPCTGNAECWPLDPQQSPRENFLKCGTGHLVEGIYCTSIVSTPLVSGILT